MLHKSGPLSPHAVKPRPLICLLFPIPCRERGCIRLNFGKIGPARLPRRPEFCLASAWILPGFRPIPYLQVIAMHSTHRYSLSAAIPAGAVPGDRGPGCA